jgi:hypothetical protein
MESDFDENTRERLVGDHRLRLLPSSSRDAAELS